MESSIEDPKSSTSAQPDDCWENENQTWKNWSPTALKKPINPVLAINESKSKFKKVLFPLETPSRKRKRDQLVQNSNTRQDFLIEKEIELVCLQADILKKEHEVRIQEQEVRMKQMAEKHELEMQLLRQQCICNK